MEAFKVANMTQLIISSKRDKKTPEEIAEEQDHEPDHEELSNAIGAHFAISPSLTLKIFMTRRTMRIVDTSRMIA